MATISAEMVKKLREKTGAGIMDCKEALSESGGDMEKGIEYLRKKGLATATKRAGRSLSEGAVGSYIHMGGKIGVMLEVNCETDFVAKTDDFQELVKNLAMHIAAASPLGIRAEDIAPEVVSKEREIYRAQAMESGKPEAMLEKIVEGKVSRFFKDSCLLNQPYVRNPDLTIQDLLNESIAKIGENITIKRFVRYQLGE